MKYGIETKKLFEAVKKNEEKAVIHFTAHQFRQTDIVRGNRKADRLQKKFSIKNFSNLLSQKELQKVKSLNVQKKKTTWTKKLHKDCQRIVGNFNWTMC